MDCELPVIDMCFLTAPSSPPVLLCGDDAGRIKAWQTQQLVSDPDNLESITHFSHTRSINHVRSFPHASRFMTCGDDKSIRIHDSKLLGTGKWVHECQHAASIQDCDTSFGDLAVCVTQDKLIMVTDFRSKTPASLHLRVENALQSIRFMPDPCCVTGCYNDIGVIYDLRMDSSSSVLPIAISDSNNRTTAPLPEFVASEPQPPQNQLGGFVPPLTPIALFNPKHLPLLAPSRFLYSSNRSTRSVFDADSKSYVKPFTGHTASISLSLPLADALRVATISRDRSCKIWDCTDTVGDCGLHTFVSPESSPPVCDAVTTPDGNGIIFTCADGTVGYWSVRAARCKVDKGGCTRAKWISQQPASSYPCTCLAIDASGTFMAIGDEMGNVRVTFA
jgi:WD40 repeat protein